MISKDKDSNLTRTFICIALSDEAIKEVARIQSLLNKRFVGRVSSIERLRSEARSTAAREEQGVFYILKFTKLENLHLTLKFLGEIPSEALEKVRTILSSISFNEFEAHLEDIGTFTYKGNPKIIWIKIAGKPIYDLQKQIDVSLSPLFKQEERFMSHLTIARIKHVPDKEYFNHSIKDISVKKVNFQVSSFKLMSSDLHDLDPVYSILEEYKLKYG